jgi:hypothetical protein
MHSTAEPSELNIDWMSLSSWVAVELAFLTPSIAPPGIFVSGDVLAFGCREAPQCHSKELRAGIRAALATVFLVPF